MSTPATSHPAIMHPHTLHKHKGVHHGVARLDPAVILTHVIKPTLLAIGLHSRESEMLLMGTAAQESNFRNVAQAGGGPAKGLFQMEKATHDDLWARILHGKSHATLTASVKLLLQGAAPSADLMMTNQAYAAAMCRVKYYSIKNPIPQSLDDQAAYWKRWYNTPLGKGTEAEYKANWARYCETLYAKS